MLLKAEESVGKHSGLAQAGFATKEGRASFVFPSGSPKIGVSGRKKASI